MTPFILSAPLTYLVVYSGGILRYDHAQDILALVGAAVGVRHENKNQLIMDISSHNPRCVAARVDNVVTQCRPP